MTEKNKLVICTTAIIRGEFHRKSIGRFYEKYKNKLAKFDIIHIINVDSPVKLTNVYDSSTTINIFDEIIPINVQKIYIKTSKPCFLDAYKNLMDYVSKLDLKKDTLIWWLEDDWECNDKCDYDFTLMFKLLKIRNSSMSFSKDGFLGSFKGGPIMSLEYFNKMFNIYSLGVTNNTCDPEKQVCRWISGIKKMNGTNSIHRDISVGKYESKIDIVYVILQKHITYIPIINDLHHKCYINKNKYNSKIKFNYYLLVSDTETLDNIKLIKLDMTDDSIKGIEYNAYIEIKQYDMTANISGKFTGDKLEELYKFFNTDSITYFTCMPYIFSDIGKYFKSKHSLIKWSGMKHRTTYVD